MTSNATNTPAQHRRGMGLATAAAALAAVGTVKLGASQLVPTDSLRDWSAGDWAVMLTAAGTVGIIVFFLVWGHFQRT